MGGKALLGHFWGLPLSGARTPYVTHASYSSVDSEKNVFFCLGEYAPIWGRYGCLKFVFLTYFGLLLLGTVSSDFGFFWTAFNRHTDVLTTLKIS